MIEPQTSGFNKLLLQRFPQDNELMLVEAHGGVKGVIQEPRAACQPGDSSCEGEEEEQQEVEREPKRTLKRTRAQTAKGQ